MTTQCLIFTIMVIVEINLYNNDDYQYDSEYYIKKHARCMVKLPSNFIKWIKIYKPI